MKDLLVNLQTEHSIRSFLVDPSGALLLEGKDAIGKSLIAWNIAEKLIGAKLVLGLNFLQIAPDDLNSIPVEQTRRIREFVKLKLKGNSLVNRVVLVKDAHRMTESAQNSLLKILEEPPKGTLIILTGNRERLKSTILSRVKQILVGQTSLNQVIDFFKHDYGIEAIQTAFLLAGGRAGLIKTYLDGTTSVAKLEVVAIAKQLIGSDQFVRMCFLNQISSDRDYLLELITTIGRLAEITLQAGLGKKAFVRWFSVYRSAYHALSELDKRDNPKLVTLNFLLSF